MPKCPACVKKQNNNSYAASIEEMIGLARAVKTLIECWEHVAEAHGHGSLNAGVYVGEIKAVEGAQKKLDSFVKHLREERRRLAKALPLS